jgi:hypothetical protein
MPSPIYQDMVNLIVGVPVWRRPSVLVNVAIWQQCTFHFKYGKVYHSNSITITDFVYIFIPNCWFRNVVPTNFGFELAEQTKC